MNTDRRRPVSIGVSFLSDFVLLEALDQVVAGAYRDGHHGQGRILAAARDKAGAVEDKQVLDVVRLVVSVENGFFGSSPIRAVPNS